MEQKKSQDIPKSVLRVSPLGVAMLMKIQSGELDPTTLGREKRLLCVRVLMHQGEMTRFEMSQLLKVDEKTIQRDRKEIRRGGELAALVMDESEIAQDIMDDAEYCAARLRAQKKYKEAFEVKVKCLETLQSMGIVKKVAEKLNVKGQLNLLEVLELDRQFREQGSPGDGEETDSGSAGHTEDNFTGGQRMEPSQN